MRMTLFGIVWIIITLFGFISKSKNYMIFILLFSALLQCNSVFFIGNSGINPLLFNSIIFIIYYFLKMPRRKSIKIDFNKIKTWLLILFFILVISVLRSKTIVVNISIILQILQILIYIITFILINKYCKFKEINVKKIFVPLMWFVIIFGFFQMSMVMGIIPKFNIVTQLFYNEVNNSSIAFLVDTRIRFYSTFMEPSYCSSFLLSSLMFLLIEKNKKRSDIALIVLLTICSILTFSTTAYVGLCICYFVYLLKSKNYKLLIYGFPFALILFFILYQNGTLDKVIFSKSTSGSAYTRGVWNRRAMRNFQSSPIIGVGYKTSRASSLIFTLLAEMGILGLASYVMLILNMIKFPKKENFDKRALYALLAVIMCQCMSLPDFNFCVFWMIMYIYAMSYYKNKEEISDGN